MRLSKSFSTEKDKMLACPCCEECIVDPRFLDLIQYLRDFMGIPFIITSGYRCRLHNDKIGGATFSQHPLGRGWDILWQDWSGKEKHRFIKEGTHIGLSIIPYERHFHIDKRLGSPIFGYGKYKNDPSQI